MMREVFRREGTWIIFAVAVLFAIGIGTTAWYFRIFSWADYEAYCEMSEDCDPIWREFYFRRIPPGCELDEVMKKWEPTWVDEFGEYKCAVYRSHNWVDVSVTAFRGKVVRVQALRSNRSIFNVLSSEEVEEMNRQRWGASDSDKLRTRIFGTMRLPTETAP